MKTTYKCADCQHKTTIKKAMQIHRQTHKNTFDLNNKKELWTEEQ